MDNKLKDFWIVWGPMSALIVILITASLILMSCQKDTMAPPEPATNAPAVPK